MSSGIMCIGVTWRFVMGRSWKKWTVLPVPAMTLVEALHYKEVGGALKGGTCNKGSNMDASGDFPPC